MAACARKCERCRRVITPRGGRTPRFCSVCGQALSGEGVQVALPGRSNDVRTDGGAVASLVLGILSIPSIGCGAIMGIIAIALGASAKQRIERSGGQLAGRGMATAGVTLGVIGAALSALVICGGLR